MSQDTEELKDLINSKHTEVVQRLTAIETTMDNNHKAYGDIPKRVAKLERIATGVKYVGSTMGLIGAGFIAWLEHKR